MRHQFKSTVLDLAEKDEKVLVILGDISVYLLRDFVAKYPDRIFNMGICEPTLLSVTAGLSAQGFFPFVHSIAPFLVERGYEQIKDDLCYNKFGGNIVTVGGSFDYAWDGATHHCYTDLALLRLLPGMEVIQPGSNKETDQLLRSQYDNGKPTYFRLSDYHHEIDFPVRFGKGVLLKDHGSALTVMTAGPILANVFEACRDFNVNLVYFHTIKPIDKEMIARFRHTQILVIHDAFGLYEAVSEVPDLSLSYHGMQDRFCLSYGTVSDARNALRLDPNSIREVLHEKLSRL